MAGFVRYTLVGVHLQEETMDAKEKCAREGCQNLLGHWRYQLPEDAAPKPQYCSNSCCALAREAKKVYRLKKLNGSHG